MKASNPRRLGLGGISLILLALIVLAIMSIRKSQDLGLHQALQFDDFFFTVESATSLPQDSSQPEADRSAFQTVDYLVRIKVENKAKRVPFQFGGQTFAFLDLSGRYPRIRPSQERSKSGELTPPFAYVLKAGESVTVDYVFTLPPNLGDLRLRVMPGGPVGEFLEWMIFGVKQFQLPLSAPSHEPS
jgi:hypothetical protein